GRDDLVGVDVAALEGNTGPRHDADSLHRRAPSSRSSGVANVPLTAVAAATAGDTRWVRPPRPWRPSKFLLLVLAARSPGWSLSGFIARHIEHPGSRQSAPAARNTSCSPSASAWAFTRCDPGTTITRGTVTVRPARTAAAARGSAIRRFGHDPMTTVSTGTSLIAVPAVRPMYSSARATVSRVVASVKSSGDGTTPSIDPTWPGFVPQVTWGVM